MLLLFLAAAGHFLARLDHPLLEPEEARYAEIPREMLLRRSFLVPVLHGETYWQKPPLLYWLVMLSYHLFGVHDWAARLVPALAGLGSVLIVTGWAWRTLGFWSGLVSGSILTLSARFLYLAGMLTMDGPLCSCVLAALASGHLALISPPDAMPARKRWLVLAALFCALGILTKGPVTLLLVGVPLLGYSWRNPRCMVPGKSELLLGVGIITIIAGPWFMLMGCTDPEAAGTFFWLHHLVRYVAPFDHEKPAWFYIPSLLLGMFPWTLLLIPLAGYLRRCSPPAELRLFILAFVWSVLFFSLSGCKRQGYILPAFPLLALILGTFVTHAWPQVHLWSRELLAGTIGMGIIVSIAAGVAELWSWHAAAMSCGGVLLAGAVVFVWQSRGATARARWAGCALCSCLLLAFAQRVWLPEYHARYGLRQQVEVGHDYFADASLPILCYPKTWDSIPFYSSRSDAELFTADKLDLLARRVRTTDRALIVVRRDAASLRLLKELAGTGTVDVLGPDGGSVIIAVVRTQSH
jgi:dolichol-phosphate mannosyltransferase